MEVYKLTDQRMRSFGGYQWRIGAWRVESGGESLCAAGYLHWYHDPALAMFFNPIHADFRHPLCFVATAAGAILEDGAVKGGSTRLRLDRQLETMHLPRWTSAQCIAFAIHVVRAGFVALTAAYQYDPDQAIEYAWRIERCTARGSATIDAWMTAWLAGTRDRTTVTRVTQEIRSIITYLEADRRTIQWGQFDHLLCLWECVQRIMQAAVMLDVGSHARAQSFAAYAVQYTDRAIRSFVTTTATSVPLRRMAHEILASPLP